MADDHRRARLSFRSWHRGTREMDLVLGSFADAYLPGFTAIQLELYEALLSEADPDLYNWVAGTEPVPAALDSDVMQLLQQHRLTPLAVG